MTWLIQNNENVYYIFISNVKLCLYMYLSEAINMNITNAVNPDYYNISIPWQPQEQEPGREQGLMVFLYESFYAG